MSNLKIEQSRAIVSCIDAAEGNPAASSSMHRILTENGVDSDLLLLHLPAIPANIFHRGMTADPKKSAEYSKDGESLRGSWWATYGLGLMSLAEMMVRKPGIFLAHYDKGFFVQEHQLGALSEDRVKRMFPEGSYLVIPDVLPRESAIKAMKKTRVRPIVWNQQAYAFSQFHDLDPLLVRPFLPDGFFNTEETKIRSRHDYVFVKSSGSGMPNSYRDKLLKTFESLQLQYRMYTPGKLFTHYGNKPHHGGKEKRTADCYWELLYRTPRIIIAYPSEMVQVVASMREAGWDGVYLALPPRGEHEVKNLEFALHFEVCNGVLNFSSETKLYAQIVDAYKLEKVPYFESSSALGKTPLLESVFS